MRGIRKLVTRTALLTIALLPMTAAVSPEAAKSALDSPLPVAMAQPLGAMDGSALVAMPQADRSDPTLPETGMLVLVGTALFGLAALVRRAT